MSKNIEILNHLIEYLQDKIDTGYHKIFYNDLMYDEKTVDCINAINDIIKENVRLNNIINELEDYLNKIKDTSTLQERMTAKFLLKYIKELKEDTK